MSAMVDRMESKRGIFIGQVSGMRIANLSSEMSALIIRVPCLICNRLFVVPSSKWLTTPRPCCDDCMELDTTKVRVDEDGWRI